MKHKFLTLALMAAMSSTMLFSCQNAEEPNIPAIEAEPDKDMVEYSISVNVPEEMRTRAASTATIGESGLYEFPQRTIDKLWYVAYYDGSVNNYSTVEREDNSPFSASAYLKEGADPSKLYFFFWAGNKEDDIDFDIWEDSTIINGTSTSTINILRDRKKVILGKKFFEDLLSSYDSFADYVQFSEDPSESTKQKTIVLKRPFAEIQVISDDFTDGRLQSEYPNGYTSIISFSNKIISAFSDFNQLKIPTVWNFGQNKYETLTQHVYNAKLYNDFSDDTYKRVSFNNREMDYYTIIYTFPDPTIRYLNFAVNAGSTGGASNSSSKFFNIKVPEEGIKANTKYIIYNKSRKNGGTGFLDGFYEYEILVNHDGTWEEPNNEQESDKVTN